MLFRVARQVPPRSMISRISGQANVLLCLFLDWNLRFQSFGGFQTSGVKAEVVVKGEGEGERKGVEIRSPLGSVY